MKHLLLSLIVLSLFTACGDKKPTFEGKEVSYWINQLADYSPDTMTKALYALEALGPEARDALPVIKEKIHGKIENVEDQTIGKKILKMIKIKKNKELPVQFVQDQDIQQLNVMQQPIQVEKN